MDPITYSLDVVDTPQCPLMEYIKNGIKTVEGRRYVPKYQQIKAGDYLILKTKDNDFVRVLVTFVHMYTSLSSYLKSETIEKTVPCAIDFQDAKRIYNQWSSKEERHQLRKLYGYAFLGIGIKVV